MLDENELSDGEFDELQRRFPRAGYWFGMLPTHPDIEALRNPGYACPPPHPPYNAPIGPQGYAVDVGPQGYGVPFPPPHGYALPMLQLLPARAPVPQPVRHAARPSMTTRNGD